VTDRIPISDEELHAYIDSQLGGVRAADITALAQYDKELAQKIETFRADKARLAEVFGPIAAQPLPQAWLRTIEKSHRDQLPWYGRRAVMALAASIAVLVVSMATLVVISQPDDEAIVAAVLKARAESQLLGPSGSSAAALDETTRLVRATLGDRVQAPDLSKLGYIITAARLRAGEKAVAIDYRDGQNRTFTLYVAPSPGAARFEMMKRGHVRICIWQDDILTAVMAGEMSAGEMLRVATLAYAGLNAV